MTKKTKPKSVQKTEKVELRQEEAVLVTFSAPQYGRFNVEENQAYVLPSQLEENERFLVLNGKTYIQVTQPMQTYLL